MLINQNKSVLPTLLIDKDEKHVIIEFDYNTIIVDAIRNLPRSKWNKDKRRWELPDDTYKNIGPLYELLFDKKFNYVLSSEIQESFFSCSKIIEEKKERENKAIELRTKKDIEEEIDFSFLKVKLTGNQKVGVQFLYLNDGCAIIGDRPGFGKTVQIIAYACSKKLDLEKQNKKFNTLVITLANMKNDWVFEINKFTNSTSRVHEGAGKILTNEQYDFTICNYEQIYSRANSNDTSSLDSLLKLVRENYFDFIVLDEGHKASNKKSKTTKALHSDFIKISQRAITTGTPMSGRPEKLWPLLHFVQPDEWPSFFQYAKRYCAAYKTPLGFWDYKGASNLDELHEKLKPIMIRRSNDNELPEKIIKTISLIMPKNIMRAYEKLEYDMIKNTDFDNKIGALEQFIKLQQFTSMYKVEASKELIDNFLEYDETQKIIVFSNWLNPVKKMCEHYGTKVVRYDGTLNEKQKLEARRLFTEDDNVNLFCATMQSAGKGLNRLTVSNNEIILDYPWNPDELEQAEARIHRKGQERLVLINRLQCQNTIDEHIAEQSNVKLKNINKVVDGNNLDIEYNIDILDNIIDFYKEKQNQIENK